MQPTATNILALDRSGLESFFYELGEKKFRAKQVLQWVYQRQTVSFDEMTDLSKSLRSQLSQSAHIVFPEIVREQVSSDGTVKWLLKLADGNGIETVYIPEEDRGTLCVSSQVGCALNCTFCATARQGYNRNLKVDEIIGQLWIANHRLEEIARQTPQSAPQFLRESRPDHDNRRPVTNVVLMGMGEPMLNLDNVIPAMELMMDDFTFGLSKRRVTLSTAGMIPGIERLKSECPVSLAVSLHAPNDPLRNELVPLNKKYSIAALLDACRNYVDDHGRQRITFEYVMLKGINDQDTHAYELAKILKSVPAKVNLIPFNPVKSIPYDCTDSAGIDRFRDILLSKGIFTVTRKTRGQDIDAACGQLAGEVQDRTRRSERLQQRVQIQ